jgi:hypothetical protein
MRREGKWLSCQTRRLEKRPLRGRWRREYRRLRESFRLLVQLSISSAIPRYGLLSGGG